MSDILKEWLIHQLGAEVQSLHPNNLCSKFQNGVLIGKLLQNYYLVNENEFSQLINQDDEAIKRANFDHLKLWLNMINISLDSDTIDGIISGQRSIIIGFLYRLCFVLESPNKLHLFERAKQKFDAFVGSFDFVDTLNVPTEEIVVNLPYKQCFTDGSLSYSSNKPVKIINTLYDKINEFERSLPEKLDIGKDRGDHSCIRYLSDLKSWKKNSKIYETWRKETTNAYLRTNLNVNSSRNMEVLRNKSIPDKLNRMSGCEKIMIKKINNERFIKNKRNTVFIENKVQFVNDCTVIDKQTTTINDETIEKMKIELIKRGRIQKEIELMERTKNVVREIIDISIKSSIYRKKYEFNIPKHLWNDWMEIFTKGLQLLYSLNDQLGLLLDPEYIDENKPNFDNELITQAALNCADISQYLSNTGKWSEDELAVKVNDHVSNYSRILGFLMYDVFTSVNSQPTSVINIKKMAFGSVVGVFDGEIDEASINKLCNALIERNILPVLPENAIHYCLCAYHTETDNNELIQILENDDDYNAAAAFNEINRVSKQTQKQKENYKLNRIECGKTVFMNIYRGKQIPKHHLIDCVLCYIKENNTVGGLVLVGFQREEIMLFEERLAKKNFPPFGSYSDIKNEYLTTLFSNKRSDIGDVETYNSSITSYLKIVPYEYMLNDAWDSMHRYYNSQNILTLLQILDKNVHLDNRKIELFCNVLTGKTVNWSQEINWIKCIHDMNEEESTTVNGVSSESEIFESRTYQRERLHGKSEIDFVDRSPSSMSFTRQEDKKHTNSKIFKAQSKSFIMELRSGNNGVILANFWKLLEKEFIESMERCFFFRRILISEQEPFIATIKKSLNEILNRPNENRIKLIKHLQSDLCHIPYSALEIPDVIKQLHVSVSDAKLILTQMTNKKIETCRQLIKNENIETWLEKQMTSMLIVYKFMLQTEIDRTVNTLFFINSYMSKLYNHKLPISLISKQVDISLNKAEKIEQHQIILENYLKIFNTNMEVVVKKIKNIFSATSDWLDETKDANNIETLEKNYAYLKIWKFLVEMENWRSSDQFKLIMARFHKDITEMYNLSILHKSKMVQQINYRLQHELDGIERICNLFETAINEKQIIRNEIIIKDDNFYLNSENILFPNRPPPYPFPLLEPYNLYIFTVDELRTMVIHLVTISPDKRILLVVLSTWLMNYVKYIPHVKWFNTSTPILRSIFGCTVNYIDWSDFIIHCLELPYPTIDELLILKQQYMELERKNPNENDIEGTINKDNFDSVFLWYQTTLMSSPSVHLRYLKAKDLLFTIFSVDGKLYYMTMLLALCRDDTPLMGLMKAISIVVNRNVTNDQHHNNDVDDRTNDKHSYQLSRKLLYEVLTICLKNYMSPDRKDIEQLVTKILNVHSERIDDTFTLLELHENDDLRYLFETGFRFNIKHISNIVNNYK